MVNKNNTGKAVGAGIIGAVVGAAVGAAAVVLSDEKNRKALGKKFDKIKGKVVEMSKDIKDKVEEVASKEVKKVEEVKKVLKK